MMRRGSETNRALVKATVKMEVSEMITTKASFRVLGTIVRYLSLLVQ